jgi:hypothetical protein
MSSALIKSNNLNQNITTLINVVSVAYGTTSSAQLVYENTSTTQKVIVYPYLARVSGVGGTGAQLSLTYYMYCKDTNSGTYFSETLGTFALGSFPTNNTLARMTTGGTQTFSSRSMVSYLMLPGDKLYFQGTNAGSNSATWDITTLVQIAE